MVALIYTAVRAAAITLNGTGVFLGITMLYRDRHAVAFPRVGAYMRGGITHVFRVATLVGALVMVASQVDYFGVFGIYPPAVRLAIKSTILLIWSSAMLTYVYYATKPCFPFAFHKNHSKIIFYFKYGILAFILVGNTCYPLTLVATSPAGLILPGFVLLAIFVATIGAAVSVYVRLLRIVKNHTAAGAKQNKTAELLVVVKNWRTFTISYCAALFLVGISVGVNVLYAITRPQDILPTAAANNFFDGTNVGIDTYREILLVAAGTVPVYMFTYKAWLRSTLAPKSRRWSGAGGRNATDTQRPQRRRSPSSSQHHRPSKLRVAIGANSLAPAPTGGRSPRTESAAEMSCSVSATVTNFTTAGYGYGGGSGPSSSPPEHTELTAFTPSVSPMPMLRNSSASMSPRPLLRYDSERSLNSFVHTQTLSKSPFRSAAAAEPSLSRSEPGAATPRAGLSSSQTCAVYNRRYQILEASSPTPIEPTRSGGLSSSPIEPTRYGGLSSSPRSGGLSSSQPTRSGGLSSSPRSGNLSSSQSTRSRNLSSSQIRAPAYKRRVAGSKSPSIQRRQAIMSRSFSTPFFQGGFAGGGNTKPQPQPQPLPEATSAPACTESPMFLSFMEFLSQPGGVGGGPRKQSPSSLPSYRRRRSERSSPYELHTHTHTIGGSGRRSESQATPARFTRGYHTRASHSLSDQIAKGTLGYAMRRSSSPVMASSSSGARRSRGSGSSSSGTSAQVSSLQAHMAHVKSQTIAELKYALTL